MVKQDWVKQGAGLWTSPETFSPDLRLASFDLGLENVFI